jgi:hypothetical protein
MKVSSLRSAWPWVWVWFAVLAGMGTYLSRFVSFDPFLAERYLSILICVPFVAILALRQGLIVRRSDVAILLAAMLTVLVAASSNSNYPAPLGFFVFVLFLLFVSQKLSPSYTRGHADHIRVVVLCILALLLLQWLIRAPGSFQLGNRFVGFFQSPTTLSTWVTSLFVISCGFSLEARTLRARSIYIATLVLAAFLVYASGTRTNLIFIALLALSEFIRPALSKRSVRAVLIALAAVAIGFAYPIYGWLAENLPGGLLAYRYGSGVDASAGLRMALFDVVFDSYLDNSWRGLLFGNGAGSSRVVVQLAFGADLLPHNDIVRLLHDFGVVTLVMFMAGVTAVGSRTYISAILSLLYVASFLHNMVYSHYLTALIVLAAGASYRAPARKDPAWS